MIQKQFICIFISILMLSQISNSTESQPFSTLHPSSLLSLRCVQTSDFKTAGKRSEIVSMHSLENILAQHTQGGNGAIDSVILSSQGYVFKYTNTLNNDHKWMTELYQAWDYENENWFDIYRMLYEYHTSGMRQSTLEQIWDFDNEQWQNEQRQMRDFSSGHPITVLDQDWDISRNNWVNTEQQHIKWNADNRISETMFQSWDTLSGAWQNIQRQVYSYNESGLTSTILVQTWQGTGEIWTDYYKEIYHYDEYDNRIESISQRFDSVSGSWQNEGRYIDSYEAKITHSLYQQWDSEKKDWGNLEQAEYFYDEQGNLLYTYWELWNSFYQDWNNYWIMNYEYDENGNMINYQSLGWNGYDWVSGQASCEFGDYYNSYSFYCSDLSAFYSEVTSVQQPQIPKALSLLQNHPNPFNPVTTIPYSIDRTGFVEITVYNMLGQKVTELVSKTLLPGNYAAVFNGSQYPAGVYYYILKTGGQIVFKKMVMIK